MGLYDFFKKTSTHATFPENELEVSLMVAANDSNSREEFITKLLWSDLIVLIESQTSSMKQGDSIQLVSLGGKIPVFTSKNRIFDKGVIEEQVQFVFMRGQNLLKMIRGSYVILNPYSDFGKEFLPSEIEDILNGNFFS